MPRAVALLLFTVFVWVLFRQDPRKKSEVSLALWIPTFWMLIIASRMVSQWFSGSGATITAEAYADGSPMDRNIFLVLILSALVVVISRKVSFQKLLRNNFWLIAFLVYAALSIMWSDFAVVSAKRYVKEIGNLLMVLIVLTERVPLEAFKTLLKRLAYILVPYSIMLYKYFSELGRGYGRWTGELYVIGVTNNKNSLGVLCAISAIGLFASLMAMWRSKTLSANKNKAIAQAVGLAMSIWLMNMAKSATSIGCCAVAMFIIFALGIRVVRRNIGAWIFATIMVVTVIYASGSLVSMTAGSLGRDDTLTGRTEIWGKVIQMTTNPLMGGGYSSFWLGERLDKLWADYAWHPTEAHDGYLEIYLDLGLIGVGLMAGVIISGFRNAIRLLKTDFEQGALRLAILVAAVLYNITESAFRPGLLMYFIFMIVVVSYPRPSGTSNLRQRAIDRPTLTDQGKGTMTEQEAHVFASPRTSAMTPPTRSGNRPPVFT